MAGIELTGLFNTSGKPGMGLALGKMSVSEYGVNYAECYGPVLPEMYATAGFKDTSVFPFDPSQAAPDWDYQRFDNPSYHLMALPGSHVRAAASGDSGLDLARIRDRAEAKDPAWWAQHGDEAFAAALAVFGVTSPAGGEPDDSQPPVPASRGLVLEEPVIERKFNPGQQRDWHGRWGSGGGRPAAAAPSAAVPMGGAVDSLAAHTLPDGQLDPAREALHQRIVAEALAHHQPKEHPTALFLGGGTASGKSTIGGGYSGQRRDRRGRGQGEDPRVQADDGRTRSEGSRVRA